MSVLVALQGGTVFVSVSDTGLGTESAPEIFVTLAISDVGLGAESTPEISVTLTASDVGLGTEDTPAVTVTFELSDAGLGTEDAPSVSVVFSLSDIGTGTESTPELSIVASGSDTGVGTEQSPDISATTALSDSVSSSESVDLVNGIAVLDNGISVEVLSVFASISASDSGTATESLDIIRTTPLGGGYKGGSGGDGGWHWHELAERYYQPERLASEYLVPSSRPAPTHSISGPRVSLLEPEFEIDTSLEEALRPLREQIANLKAFIQKLKIQHRGDLNQLRMDLFRAQAKIAGLESALRKLTAEFSTLKAKLAGPVQPLAAPAPAPIESKKSTPSHAGRYLGFALLTYCVSGSLREPLRSIGFRASETLALAGLAELISNWLE